MTRLARRRAFGWVAAELRLQLHQIGEDIGLAPLQMTLQGWIVLAVGFAVSYIVALGVVAWFMAWVRRRGFVPFAIYRIIVGLLVLIFLKNS